MSLREHRGPVRVPNSPRWMMPGEVYAYRVNKPNAFLGLPFIGRHWGYVGQTRNPKARHGEHMDGGGRYGKGPAPWSDLRPKRYTLFKVSHCPQWILNLMERLAVYLLWPVYNDKMNRWNPRRISRIRAARHRYFRERRLRIPVLQPLTMIMLALMILGAWMVTR